MYVHVHMYIDRPYVHVGLVDIYFKIPIEILGNGVWEAIDELQDEELRRLASLLPETVLRSCANSTTTKYLYAFERWKNWAEPRAEVNVFPVQEIHFSLYLQHLSEVTGSKAAIEEAVNAVGWINQIAGRKPIASPPIVRATLAGLQRILAKPKVKKEPVTVDILQKLVSSWGFPPVCVIFA